MGEGKIKATLMLKKENAVRFEPTEYSHFTYFEYKHDI